MAQLSIPSLTRTAALVTALALLPPCVPAWAEANDAFIGALMPIAGRNGNAPCPAGWMSAEGQLLRVNQHQALFSLLGTTYGGDGVSTFALPNLRGRTAVGAGQGSGLSSLALGQHAGSESVTLTPSNLPAHMHGLPATTAAATHATPSATRILAQAQNMGVYASGGTPIPLAQSAPAGGSQPIFVMSPYLSITWCIAIRGVFPSRP